MSFSLKSIELKNIRAHEYFLFEPALEGITAISGDNGSGKSTIVDAFAWCLYGTRPSGVRNKDLVKDGVDPKKKPVWIKAHLIISGIEYLIERKILNVQGAVECNVWGKLEDDNKFTSVAGPGVSHVEKFVRNELGMNEKGFLTSVLIQQKQVDQIVSASPRERGAVIEELTGISSITEAIRQTNENKRGLQKAASIFHTGDINEAEEKVSKQETLCKEIKKKESQAVSKFQENKSLFSDMKEEFSEQKQKVAKRRKYNQKLESLEERIEFLENQSKEDLEYIKKHRDTYGTTMIIDVKDAKAAVNEKRDESYSLKSQISALKKQVEENNTNIEKCILLKKDYEQLEKALNDKKDKEEQLEQVEKELEANKSKKSMLTSEIKHSNSSHKHIDGKDKNCPVCKSKIDDPEELKAEIQKDIKKFKEEKKTVTEKIKELKNKKSELENEIKDLGIVAEAIKEEKRLNDIVNSDINKLSELNAKFASFKSDLKVLEKEYNNALKIKADKNSLEAAKKRSLTVNAKIDEAKSNVDKITKELSELDALTDRSFEALEKRLDRGRDKLTKMSVKGKEIHGRRKLEEERLEDYKKNLKEVEIAMEKYNGIAKEIDIATGAAAMLAAFKADRIEYSIPTLEFFASDFLTKFTGGAFTKMTIDEKFNAFVTTSKGVVRPVAQLSGGELSSAAIALRLGIAMLLNSSEKNVLILDEVLVSMDEDRSRQIMETIGSMTNSQVIFIAHNTDINSVADKTVLVEKQGKPKGA